MRVFLLVFATALAAQVPHELPEGGFALPNGWRITPFGKSIPTEDLILNMQPSPDARAVIVQHGGYNPHGLVVIDTETESAVQRIALPNAWLGLAWSRDGSRLFVSGGNSNHPRNTSGPAPIYVFHYGDGRLGETPALRWNDSVPSSQTYWAGLAQHPTEDLLYAANRGDDPLAGNVTVFDTETGREVSHIPVGVSPYDLVLSPPGDTLYVSNWSSRSISVIDTRANRVVDEISVEINPNDMELGSDGRLYVSNGNENTVTVIDTAQRRAIETISVALTPRAPEGATPNGLALDRRNQMLFVANADNNCIAVVSVATPGKSQVLGFIPAGWYPSALHLTGKGRLYIGNSKGLSAHANPEGPNSPIARKGPNTQTIKHIQKGSVNIIPVSDLRSQIKTWSKQVYDNVPYRDELLARARPSNEPSIVPNDPHAGSPIKHVIYVIKENRTYDQVFGDIKKGNGDPRLTIFGEEVTPNHHALALQWVLLDNLYCDGEVSVDGHSWSNSAYPPTTTKRCGRPNMAGTARRRGRRRTFLPPATSGTLRRTRG
jgi:YVTN family beta-propeller protein